MTDVYDIHRDLRRNPLLRAPLKKNNETARPAPDRRPDPFGSGLEHVLNDLKLQWHRGHRHLRPRRRFRT